MRKWLFLFLALVLLIPSPAHAQDAVALKTLSVALWSEHDQPSMLVLYDFEVTDNTELPATVEMWVPREGNITAVAYQENNALLIAQYQTRPAQDDAWVVIDVSVTKRTTYHIEYYQPLTRDGNVRSFNYQWKGNYSVDNFDIEVQVPGDSKEIGTSPVIPFTPNQSVQSGGAQASGLKQGQGYQLQLSYSRANETTVVTPASSNVEPVTPVDSNTDGRVALDNLPLILGGFGVVLVAVALFYFLRNNSMRDSQPRKRRHRSTETSSQIYCHECGTRAQEGDRFCRTCGSKLRL